MNVLDSKDLEVPIIRKDIALPWILSSLVWFLLIVGLGTIMRIFFAFHLSFFVNFEFTKHAHSHTAFWGWAGPALFGFLLGYGIDEKKRKPFLEEILFWLIQIFTALAFPSFFFKGYSALSIVFSSFFVLIWLVFIGYYYKTREYNYFQNSLVGKIFQLSLLFLLLSTLPTFFLPVSILSGFGKESFKTLSIHFFLETYSEGWLYLFSLGILLFLSGFHRSVSTFREKLVFLFVFLSIFFCSFRSTLDLLIPVVRSLVFISSFSWGLVQLFLSIYFFTRVGEIQVRILWAFVLFKSLLDIFVSFPMMEAFLSVKSFGIFYLHLKLLGVTSFTLLFFINKYMIKNTKMRIFHSIGLLTGILLTLMALGLIASSQFFLLESNTVIWKLGQGLAVLAAILVACFTMGLLYFLLAQSRIERNLSPD